MGHLTVISICRVGRSKELSQPTRPRADKYIIRKVIPSGFPPPTITKSLMVAVCVLTACSTVWADTIYVKSGSSGDGSSWANAYGDLQDALDDADPNDEIWVAAGTYKPTSDYGLDIGDRGKHFRMKNRVAIYGGFPNTGDPGMEDRDPNNYETILSGDLTGND